MRILRVRFTSHSLNEQTGAMSLQLLWSPKERETFGWWMSTTAPPDGKIFIPRTANTIFIFPVLLAPSRTTSTSAVIPFNGYPLNSNVTSPHLVRLPVSPLPNVGLTRFKPSPEVAHLGASSASIVPAASHPSSPRSAPSAATNKAMTSSPSKQVVPFSSSRSKSIGKGQLS